ncbi:MAG: ATP-binding protein [Anaerolineaceae bacterium]
MNRSLKSRMILTYLAVALVTILIVILVIRLTSDQSLMDMVVDQQVSQLSESVQVYYGANGNLDGFFDYYMGTGPVNQPQKQQGASNQPPRRETLRGLLGLVDASYGAVFPTFTYAIGEIVPENLIQDAEAVKIDGQTVAWILKDPNLQFELNPEEQRYVQRTNLAIGLAALVGVATAVILGILLAGNLIKPIQKLTQASASLAQGELGKQVPVTSRDELGQLTQTFNQMSADLARGDQERKRMTADITHDLSTPLQIISGYIEMLEDGEVQLTPERIEIIKTEIDHLRRLVGDLTTLSQAEAGGLDIQKAPVNPNQLLESVYNAYLPIASRQKVHLNLETQPTDCLVEVDEGRMIQVLKNLVENALRYTPAGGRITLSAHTSNQVELRVADTGSGIDSEDLPYVFERFYQADKARPANKGKMGLGLAICKALTAAQGCSISAQSAGKDQGTTMVITIARCLPEPES